MHASMNEGLSLYPPVKEVDLGAYVFHEMQSNILVCLHCILQLDLQHMTPIVMVRLMLY